MRPKVDEFENSEGIELTHEKMIMRALGFLAASCLENQAKEIELTFRVGKKILVSADISFDFAQIEEE